MTKNNKCYRIIWPKPKHKVTTENYKKISDLMRRTYNRIHYGGIEKND